ncbi:MAG TPA: arsenic resistance N-acetyltransferase ArsN2 [Blastocatellia bacterium]|nr:arsenic resistance N-acetyltransferase ArsN2 [Blastocatellia bacterium]
MSMENLEIIIRPATTADVSAIVDLLTSSHLPIDGVEQFIDDFFVAESDSRIIGCAGLEIYGAAGLVRSVAVAPEYRGRKIAEKLYGELVNRGREKGLRELALLTTDAAAYFTRFGFKVTKREEIDPDLLESEQFKTICPSTAICMRVALGCKPIGTQLGLKRGL